MSEFPSIERLLKYRDRPTFCEHNWRVLAQFWHPVAFTVEVTDHPIKRRLLDVELLLVRYQQTLLVAEDRCPHRGTKLSHGQFENGVLHCAYHGFQFDVEGHCVRIPSTAPDYHPPSRLRLHKVRHCERYGIVWVCLDAQSPRSLPDWPYLLDASFQRVDMQLRMKTGAGRHIENFCDTAHFPFTHTGTFGSRNHTLVPPYDLQESPEAITFDLTLETLAEAITIQEDDIKCTVFLPH